MKKYLKTFFALFLLSLLSLPSFAVTFSKGKLKIQDIEGGKTIRSLSFSFIKSSNLVKIKLNKETYYLVDLKTNTLSIINTKNKTIIKTKADEYFPPLAVFDYETLQRNKNNYFKLNGVEYFFDKKNNKTKKVKIKNQDKVQIITVLENFDKPENKNDNKFSLPKNYKIMELIN